MSYSLSAREPEQVWGNRINDVPWRPLEAHRQTSAYWAESMAQVVSGLKTQEEVSF